MIQPHCMGLPFPKRDTDAVGVTWITPVTSQEWANWLGGSNAVAVVKLPSAADLDAVAEEQRVKEKTGMYYDKDGWYPPS